LFDSFQPECRFRTAFMKLLDKLRKLLQVFRFASVAFPGLSSYSTGTGVALTSMNDASIATHWQRAHQAPYLYQSPSNRESAPSGKRHRKAPEDLGHKNEVPENASSEGSATDRLGNGRKRGPLCMRPGLPLCWRDSAPWCAKSQVFSIAV
jgi:hypothetical protein